MDIYDYTAIAEIGERVLKGELLTEYHEEVFEHYLDSGSVDLRETVAAYLAQNNPVSYQALERLSRWSEALIAKRLENLLAQPQFQTPQTAARAAQLSIALSSWIDHDQMTRLAALIGLDAHPLKMPGLSGLYFGDMVNCALAADNVDPQNPAFDEVQLKDGSGRSAAELARLVLALYMCTGLLHTSWRHEDKVVLTREEETAAGMLNLGSLRGVLDKLLPECRERCSVQMLPYLRFADEEQAAAAVALGGELCASQRRCILHGRACLRECRAFRTAIRTSDTDAAAFWTAQHGSCEIASRYDRDSIVGHLANMSFIGSGRTLATVRPDGAPAGWAPSAVPSGTEGIEQKIRDHYEAAEESLDLQMLYDYGLRVGWKPDLWKRLFMLDCFSHLTENIVWSQGRQSFEIRGSTLLDAFGQAVELGAGRVTLATPGNLERTALERWRARLASAPKPKVLPTQLFEPVYTYRDLRPDRFEGCHIPVESIDRLQIVFPDMEIGKLHMGLWWRLDYKRAHDWPYADEAYKLGKLSCKPGHTWLLWDLHHAVYQLDVLTMAERANRDDLSLLHVFENARPDDFRCLARQVFAAPGATVLRAELLALAQRRGIDVLLGELQIESG